MVVIWSRRLFGGSKDRGANCILNQSKVEFEEVVSVVLSKNCVSSSVYRCGGKTKLRHLKIFHLIEVGS